MSEARGHGIGSLFRGLKGLRGRGGSSSSIGSSSRGRRVFDKVKSIFGGRRTNKGSSSTSSLGQDVSPSRGRRVWNRVKSIGGGLVGAGTLGGVGFSIYDALRGSDDADQPYDYGGLY